MALNQNPCHANRVLSVASCLPQFSFILGRALILLCVYPTQVITLSMKDLQAGGVSDPNHPTDLCPHFRILGERSVNQFLCWELIENILLAQVTRVSPDQRIDFVGDSYFKRARFLSDSSLVCSQWTNPAQSLLVSSVLVETKHRSRTPEMVSDAFISGGVATKRFATKNLDLRGNGFDSLEGLQLTRILEHCRGITRLRLFRVNNVVSLLQNPKFAG